jgi:hypothetical protein
MDPRLLALKGLIMEFGCVVEDGTWFERFLNDRLLDPTTAAQVAKVAVLDREYGEALEPAGVLEAIASVDGMPHVAVAGALREVWLDYGLQFDDPNDLVSLFCRAREHGSATLMTGEELERLRSLPPVVEIFRGQVFCDGRRPSNASWTLSKEVACWYAAPVPNLGQPFGWILSSRVPRDLVLALFLERGEQEVIIDPSPFLIPGYPVRAERGSCTEFPTHLSRVRMSSAD